MRRIRRRSLLAAPALLAAGGARAGRGFPPFSPLPAHPDGAPDVRSIALPGFPGAHAIWGATGNDGQGHVWIGVSADGGDNSAHLLEYDPERDEIADRGDVLANLRHLRLYRAGEKQIKIHSKIIQADDGFLYFTSTDEDGEQDDGTAPPTFGSHLWRMRPPDGAWEHLLAVPEGLTCAAGSGRWIFALGLWNHVLFRYDTLTGQVRRVVVGSVGGHMTRNFVVDPAGHAYVPRVRADAAGVHADLIEYDGDLTEIAATPMDNYAPGLAPGDAHGIIGMIVLADDEIIISTSAGYLYGIMPSIVGAATVRPRGWFHPSGPAYAPSLFTWDGVRFIVGVARIDGVPTWDWVVHDRRTGTSHAIPLPIPLHRLTLLYGSVTHDRRGRFYVVGRTTRADGSKMPIALQVDAAG